MLIVNADDWGRNSDATDRCIDCYNKKRISAVSAMVFMEDSERAAEFASKHNLNVGLHLNYTTPYSGIVAEELSVSHRRIAEFLLTNRFSRIVYHPRLKSDFAFVYQSQAEEFKRLYGSFPGRVDGHHNMHLCANMLIDRIIPAGTTVRRNHSFFPGEKSILNRVYRRLVDKQLAKTYRCTDYFFNLPSYDKLHKLDKIVRLARDFTVELVVHPENVRDYETLMSDAFIKRLGVPPCG